MNTATRSLLEEAVREHRAGRIDLAADGYRQVLARERDQVDALHLLGVAERERGDLAQARKLLERVLRLRPGFAAALGNLGMVRAEEGALAEAIELYERALALDASLAETRLNLANALLARGEPGRAERVLVELLAAQPLAQAHRLLGSLRWEAGAREEGLAQLVAAVTVQPLYPDAWRQLGQMWFALGRAEEATNCLARAIEQRPGLADAHNDLGNALQRLGRTLEAAASYERALKLRPDCVEAWNNLGGLLIRRGEFPAALAALGQALVLAPHDADVHLSLGRLHRQRGEHARAEACFRTALRLRPGCPSGLNNLAVTLTELGRQAEAAEALEAALAARPDLPEAWNNLGNVRKAQGELAAALDAFARAVELQPGYVAAHSNFLFTLAYTDEIPPAQKFDLHRAWAERHAAGLPVHTHRNERDPARRLRIGYVSPDFRAHACALFLEPLLREHDRASVEVHAYAEVAAPDAVTARLRGLVDHWHDTVGLDDDELAARIAADGIDVLVDLAGHTAGNRLLAFARKPAPVQLTWLGYPATTGLAAMDWRLTDAVTEPPGESDALYTERLFRLPHSLWCYQPAADMRRAPSPLPAAARGHVTFGSFNSYTKVGPRVVELWADVLHAVPDSRLLMITVPAGEPQAALWARFEALGIARERVELHGRLPRGDYVAAFDRVDIALDPFPCNGGTTTCDALWMGLPVVALRGDSFLSRASLSVLSAAGCAGWAVADTTDYVATCRALACDLDVLAATRAALRAQVAASPLTDARGFARDVEAAYREMWQAWCARAA